MPSSIAHGSHCSLLNVERLHALELFVAGVALHESTASEQAIGGSKSSLIITEDLVTPKVSCSSLPNTDESFANISWDGIGQLYYVRTSNGTNITTPLLGSLGQSVSDSRLKVVHEQLDQEECVANIMALTPVRFDQYCERLNEDIRAVDLNDGRSRLKANASGFIAQDSFAFRVPSDDESKPERVDMDSLVAQLVGVVQQLQSRVVQLESVV